MTVWIEYAIVQNLITDLSLLYLTNKTLRLPINLIRLFFASAVGTAFAVLLPLLPLSGIFSFLVRFAFGAILCLIGVPAKKSANFSALFLFYFYTFSYGGFLLGLYSVFSVEYNRDCYTAGSFAGVALALLPFFAVFCLYAVRKLVRRLRNKRVNYLCRVFIGGESLALNGLMDTGNSLKYKNSPVCLIDQSVQKRCKKAFPIEDYIVVRTATGEGVLPVFCTKIQIYSEEKGNIIDKVYFAVSPQPLGGDYGVILHPQLLKEEDNV